MAVPTGIEPAISCVTGRHVNRYTTGQCNNNINLFMLVATPSEQLLIMFYM
ncbi:MAG: hypothetical protein Q8906_03810 [Bacillota bacterium]|nr:hypothetical protein [Bacillota bacterium]